MGITAENLAEKYQVTRAEQDEFSVQSQNKAEKARSDGRFKDEIAAVTVKGRKGDTIVADDEYIRSGVTIDSVSGVRPAFKKDGTVTAANASGLNDGAAALVVMTREEAEKRGAPVLATIKSWASAGVDPSIMGIGPVPASRRALEKAGWEIADLDLIEANEAFAAQALSVNKEMGWDAAKINVNGGAIAIGHPSGASGARVLITLLYQMQKRDAKKGIETLCMGGGVGIATCVGGGVGGGQKKRQRRRERDRPSDRRIGRARADHLALGDAEARCEEGSCDPVHRRRHGHRDVRRAVSRGLAEATPTVPRDRQVMDAPPDGPRNKSGVTKGFAKMSRAAA